MESTNASTMDAEHPSDAPAACPGVSSQLAGQATPCQGCPNQRLCASGAAASSRPQDDPSLPQLRERLASVKHKILILSGKGGVGKSTVACTLTQMFACLNPEKQIAILDIDLCGPTVPIMMGCLGEEIHQSASGWSPIFVEENLCVMSVAFLLSSADDAVIWRGPKKNGLIKQFLRDVEWSNVDYLFIDCPPGTSDEHLSIVQYLRVAGGVDGALVITTPQEVALADVRKELNFCQKVSLPVLGVVENMSTFLCPHCGDANPLFPPTSGGADVLVQKFQSTVGPTEKPIQVLARLPLDPRITRLCDEGRSVTSLIMEGGQIPQDNPFLVELEALARKVMALCEPSAPGTCSGNS